VYGRPNPAPTFKIYGDIANSGINPPVTCYYGLPAILRWFPGMQHLPNYCTGGATTSASATDGSRVTRRISPSLPLFDHLEAADHGYGGRRQQDLRRTTASTATPVLTLGSLAYPSSAVLRTALCGRRVMTIRTWVRARR